MVESGSEISYFYTYKPFLAMLTFIGDYPCKLDAKGRFLLPAAFRKLLAASSEDRFVMRKNLYENCLDLFPSSEWDKQLAKIRSQLNPFNRKHATFLREFFRGTAEVQVDSNGRILIPKKYFTDTDLSKGLTLVGQDGKIEIWDTEKYQDSGMNQEEFNQLANDILGDNTAL